MPQRAARYGRPDIPDHSGTGQELTCIRIRPKSGPLGGTEDVLFDLGRPRKVRGFDFTVGAGCERLAPRLLDVIDEKGTVLVKDIRVPPCSANRPLTLSFAPQTAQWIGFRVKDPSPEWRLESVRVRYSTFAGCGSLSVITPDADITGT